jgi:hypothetical protein
MLRIQTLQFLIVAIAWTPSSAYGQTHDVAANSNNNKREKNVDFSSLSPASIPTNAEMDLVVEREITTAV